MLASEAQHWTLRLAGEHTRTIRFDFLNRDKSRSRTAFALAPGKPVRLVLADGRASLDGQALAVQPQQASFASVMGALRFVTPRPYRPQDFPMLQAKDALKGVVERGQYR